jgi:hypothetical protein|tara:strand:+ start:108 stop:281 length:174 start_codon:yes stop_codon:yes gene_type:complete
MLELGEAVTFEFLRITSNNSLVSATCAIEGGEDAVALGKVEELILEGVPPWQLTRDG